MSGKEALGKMVKNKKRGFLSGIVIGMLVFSTLLFAFTGLVRGVDPSINYASPDNTDTFVDVVRGEGVNITVNVTDGDSNLAQVVLTSNATATGSWQPFYDSGALGGVAYHNHTIVNGNMTGSWETYYYNISANDGTWHNTTYSFTTEYVWGDKSMIFGDFRAAPNNMDYSVMYKNATNDYFLWVGNSSIDVKTSTDCSWMTQSKVDVNAGEYPSCAVTYDDKVYIYYHNGDYLYYSTWDGSTWSSTSTGIGQRAYNPFSHPDSYRYGYGCTVKYFNGMWNFIVGYTTTTSIYLRYYTSLSPDGPYSVQTNIASGYQYNYLGTNNHYKSWFMPSLNILNGKLVLTFVDDGRDLHWETYDGVSWTDKGVIENDLGTSSDEIQGHWQSTIKDPVNNQLVSIYINASGDMYYRTLTDTDGSWSTPHLIFTPESSYLIKYPHVDYIDHRVVITFSYNQRGNYNIYSISAPDYRSEAVNGTLKQYNRYQFPDATPSQTHVNSSVVSYKNINDRAFSEINITYSDMGSIQCESNFKLWGSTDNSSFTDLGTTNATGVLPSINSTTWAGGMNWEVGDVRYFKLEILDVGSVPEDLHSCDEDWIWEITLV